jgi:hypothetical protein
MVALKGGKLNQINQTDMNRGRHEGEGKKENVVVQHS